MCGRLSIDSDKSGSGQGIQERDEMEAGQDEWALDT